MSEEEYSIKFPKIQANFSSTNLVFIINQIKSRLTSVLYFKCHFYDRHNTIIYTYVSPRWVIDTEYKTRKRTFSISNDVYKEVIDVQIELIAIGNSSENPLHFTECMFAEDDGINVYHMPNEVIKETNIGFLKSRYVNLYDRNGNYVQIIRPTGQDFTTKTLTKSTCTVLAPHLSNEGDIDDDVNVFMEFINQSEQRIDVLR